MYGPASRAGETRSEARGNRAFGGATVLPQYSDFSLYHALLGGD